jgi:hypothetical protein
LRLFLTALFEAQARCQAGTQLANSRRLQAGGDEISWIDLLTSDAQRAGDGQTYMGVAAKKAR